MGDLVLVLVQKWVQVSDLEWAFDWVLKLANASDYESDLKRAIR